MLSRKNINRVAPYPEGTAIEIDIVARVLHLNQARDDVTLRDAIFRAQRQNHLVVFIRITDAVNRRNSRHNHHIAPLHQRFCAGKSHLLNVLIDRRIFFNKQIPLRHIGFRLIVVVVTDEILDRIQRKEITKLAVQLCCQRFVRRENNRRAT